MLYARGAPALITSLGKISILKETPRQRHTHIQEMMMGLNNSYVNAQESTPRGVLFMCAVRK